MSIDGTVAIQFQFNDRRTTSAGTNGVLTINPLNAKAAYVNGAGAGQANQVFGYGGTGQRTFSGSTDVLDFLSGLIDEYGTSVALVRFKAIHIRNTGNANIVVGVGTDPINTLLNAAGTLTLPPGAFFVAGTPDATGWVVTPSTNMNLTITGTSGQTYEIFVAGSTT